MPTLLTYYNDLPSLRLLFESRRRNGPIHEDIDQELLFEWILHRFHSATNFYAAVEMEWMHFANIVKRLDKLIEVIYDLPYDEWLPIERSLIIRLTSLSLEYNKSKFLISLGIKIVIDKEIANWKNKYHTDLYSQNIALTPSYHTFWAEEYIGLAELSLIGYHFGPHSEYYMRQGMKFARKHYSGSLRYLQHRSDKLSLVYSSLSESSANKLSNEIDSMKLSLRIRRSQKIELLLATRHFIFSKKI